MNFEDDCIACTEEQYQVSETSETAKKVKSVGETDNLALRFNLKPCEFHICILFCGSSRFVINAHVVGVKELLELLMLYLVFSKITA